MSMNLDRMATDTLTAGPSAKLGGNPSPGTSLHSPQTAMEQEVDNNYFCSVNLEKSSVKVVLYFSDDDALGMVLLRKCREASYDALLVHSQEKVMQQFQDPRQQAVLVMDTPLHSLSPRTPSRQKEVIQMIHTQGLSVCVTLVAIVQRLENDRLTQSLMASLLVAGFSKVLTVDDCHFRFVWELQLLERAEIRLKQQLVFAHALYEAVEQSGDAIQITGVDSLIMYVNRSFVDLSGYSREEAVGKPALDILSLFDSKGENGTLSKGQKWDGQVCARRKSGSVIKQHLKLIPVQNSRGHVTHHVTIQRLASTSHDYDALRITSPKHPDGHGLLSVRRHPRLGHHTILETPMEKVVKMLIETKDSPECTSDVRVAFEKILDILNTTELYAPISSSGQTEGRRTRGMVDALLNVGALNGRRHSGAESTGLRVSHAPHHMRHPPITPPPAQVQEALQGWYTWNFDIISLEQASSNETLYYLGMKVFKEFELCDVLNIDEPVLISWFRLMESNYRDNPYHNSTHASDVLQSTAYLVKHLQDHLASQGEMLEPMEVAALLISSVIHDLDHPGRTNPFLCNTEHALAVLYNDSAVLENHHIAASFKLTKEHQQANIYQNLDSVTYRSLRASVIDLVLATDMAKHFEHLTKFNNSLSVAEDTHPGSTTSLTPNKESRETRTLMKRILVKCADISNPCRPRELCKTWAYRIAEEYFAQTDEEKERDLPVVFGDFDRKTCKISVTQVKFIDYFITGLFESWHNYCPIPQLMEHLTSNYEFWKGQHTCSSSSSASEDDELEIRSSGV